MKKIGYSTIGVIFTALIIIISFASCDSLTGLLNNDPTTTTTVTVSPADLSTLADVVSHLPSPADLMKLDDATDKAFQRAIYSSAGKGKPAGVELSNYLVNGGFHTYSAVFYSEALAGLKSLGNVAMNTLVTLPESTMFDAWFPSYSQKALWTKTDTESVIKVTFASTGYLIHILINVKQDNDNIGKCLVSISLDLDLGEQQVDFISDYVETTGVFKSYLDVGDSGGGHQYMISYPKDDGSRVLGLKNDPWSYAYGYKDAKGEIFARYDLDDDLIQGIEYGTSTGEYQEAEEIGGTSIPLYRYEDIPGVKIGFDESTPGNIWVDSNEDGIKDTSEELIPGEIKNMYFLLYYNAGYYFTDFGNYIPCIAINDIEASHSLHGRFVLKQPYEVADTTYLNSRLAAIKSQLNLSYDKTFYDGRIADMHGETFPE